MKGVFRVKEQKKISLESLVSEIEKNGRIGRLGKVFKTEKNYYFYDLRHKNTSIPVLRDRGYLLFFNFTYVVIPSVIPLVNSSIALAVETANSIDIPFSFL